MRGDRNRNKNRPVLTSIVSRWGALLSCPVLADEDSSGSAGEVEEPEENPPPSTSLPQTPEQEKYLRQHFQTLADAEGNGRHRRQTVRADPGDGRAHTSRPATAERFNGSLKDLKPPEPGDEEKAAFLNPRLSISARFLARCQKNSRWAAGWCLSVQWGRGFLLLTPSLIPQAGGCLPPAGTAPAAEPGPRPGAARGPAENSQGAPAIRGKSAFCLREGEIPKKRCFHSSSQAQQCFCRLFRNCWMKNLGKQERKQAPRPANPRVSV